MPIKEVFGEVVIKRLLSGGETEIVCYSMDLLQCFLELRDPETVVDLVLPAEVCKHGSGWLTTIVRECRTWRAVVEDGWMDGPGVHNNGKSVMGFEKLCGFLDYVLVLMEI